MAAQALQHPDDVTHMIAGKPKRAAVGQKPDQCFDGVVRDKTAAVVAFFRPRVRIKREHLCQAGVGQGGKELSSVIVENPDVGQAFAFDQAQQIGDAVDEGIADRKRVV